MATDEELLNRWKPKLCYDSLEAFFVDDPAQMVVNPGNTLRRGGAGGKVIAAAPPKPKQKAPAVPLLWWEADGPPPGGKKTLALDWPKYGDAATRGEANDRLSIAGRDYRTQYVALRKARPDLRNKIVARAVRDPDTGQLWLQYWLWYIYNDYQLAFNVGLHEGDWEMIQLGLEGDVPVVAVYAQHDVAERRPWDLVKKAANGETPLVFSARGSHASYYEAGLFETGAWFDITDGKRSAKQTDLIIVRDDDLPGWVRWEGMWGDTEPQIRGLHTPSPKGPIKHRLQWSHPQQWANSAAERRSPGTAKDAPAIQVARAQDHVVLNFDFTRVEEPPAVIVVNVNSSEVANEPPRTFTFNVEDQRAGRIVTSIALVAGHSYEANIATTSRAGVPSAPLLRYLPGKDIRPKTTVTSRVGAFVGPLAEKVKGVFRRRRGGGDGP